MRVVLDTTILVRAGASPHGLARHLLLAIITARHPLILSNDLTDASSLVFGVGSSPRAKGKALGQ
ncbi:hypothetical protein SBA2_50017 [Acidobacteriia bacterium SbA2]|nr:hypothetical protein SBA2_50017 [Acidobacteriia bacterium SbA2]